jgi:hypothetical protein
MKGKNFDLFNFFFAKKIIFPEGKNLDVFNFFYSFAAVIILIGVIAKLLEWPSQDILITLGLGIEAVVFGVSSIKFIDKKEPEVSKKPESVTFLDKSESASSAASDTNPNNVTPDYNFYKDEHTKKLIYDQDIIALDSVSEEISTIEINDSHPTPDMILEVSQEFSNFISNEVLPEINELTQYETALTETEIDPMKEQENKEIYIASDNAFESATAAPKSDNLFLNRFNLYLFDLKWISINSKDYDFLRAIVLKIFNRELPHSSIFQLLEHTSLNLPSASINDFKLDKPHIISIEEFRLLLLLLKTSGLEIFFEKHIVASNKNNEYIIRKRKDNEYQVFGNIRQQVLIYAHNNFSSNIFISIALEDFKNLSHFSELNLINYFIANVSQDSYAQINDLLSIANLSSDNLLLSILNKITPIEHHFSSEQNLYKLKTILKILSMFNDFLLIKNLFHSKIKFFDTENMLFDVQDLIRFKSSTLSFGPNNENVINLTDLFPNSYLDREKQIKDLTDTLLKEGYLDHEFIYTIFENLKTDNKSSIQNKLNHYLDFTNTQPNNAQLAFILLLKHSI